MNSFTIDLVRVTAGTEVHMSGLLVAVRPGRLDEVARGVAAVAGAAVHAQDDAGSRLVVTLEGDSLDTQQAACAALAGLPGVASVDLVCHYVDERGQP